MPPSPSASPAAADALLNPVALGDRATHGWMRRGLLRALVHRASPEVAGTAGENAGARSASPPLPLLCSTRGTEAQEEEDDRAGPLPLPLGPTHQWPSRLSPRGKWKRGFQNTLSVFCPGPYLKIFFL